MVREHLKSDLQKCPPTQKFKKCHPPPLVINSGCFGVKFPSKEQEHVMNMKKEKRKHVLMFVKKLHAARGKLFDLLPTRPEALLSLNELL